MDPTGLVIGAVGLVSLFKTVVQVSDIIDASKRYGNDSEILSIKLGIERVRLTMWGEKLGLTDANLDTSESFEAQLDGRLSDRRVSLAVSDVLVCMKRLFEDSTALKRRYGLQSIDDTVATIAGGVRGGNVLQETFRRTFDKFNSAAATSQQNISLKSSSKWAISDKKRFELLIQDLRDFNDSLSAFFPDIETQTQRDMNAEIKASNNVQSLRLIQDAAAEDHATLSDAASARIEEISQRDILSDKASSILLRPIDLNALAKQVDRLQIQLKHKNRGMLNTSIIHPSGTMYSSYVGWEEINDEDHYLELDKEVEYAKPLYLAWALQFAPDKKDKFNDEDYSDFDTEAGRKYIGKIPATVTVEGYTSEFSSWARVNTPGKSELILSSTHSPPKVSIKDLVSRMRILQLREGQLPWGSTDKSNWEETKNFVGTTGSGWARPEYEYEMSSQKMELLNMLNRSDLFDYYSGNDAMGYYVNGGEKGILLFYLNMILAYELLIRLQRSSEYAGSGTPRVIAAMALAERWMKSVLIKLPDETKTNCEYHSLVHERQVEGLIRFAEAIDWPYIYEMREFIEDAYIKLRSGGRLANPVWSWIFGLILPGNNFIFIIMMSLVGATPGLMESLGVNRYPAAGLALPDRSYWRANTVTGRVLGGLKGIKATCGWIGPCPPPEGVKPGWIRVKARSVAFRKPDVQYEIEETESDDGTITSRQRTPLTTKLSGSWIKSAGDPKNWRTVDGLTRAVDNCEFQTLRLQKIQTDPDLSGNEPVPGSEEYRATVEFSIVGKLVTYTLYSRPTFITATHCIDGPHSIHVKDLLRLENVVNAADLKSKKHNDTGVFIINATCEGGELVARAWCSENEQHAVIRRAPGPCLTCAVKMASENGLGVNCLIWA